MTLQIDHKQLRRALGQFPTGVCVMTAHTPEGEDLGMTMSSFNSLSLSPPLVLFSIDKRAHSLGAWLGVGGYAVNILAEAQQDMSIRFARPLSDKWEGVPFDRGFANAPILRDVAACFECAAHATQDVGDHILFIAEVRKVSTNPDSQPLVFCKGQYNGLKSAESAAEQGAYQIRGNHQMQKTGAEHINSLRDGRQVFLNGQLVEDVTTHPAYRNAVASVGRLYDFQSDPGNLDLMTFKTPDGDGSRANRIWQLPTSHADLVERRKGLEAWTELHGGFLGRAPDHVASCISGMYMGAEVFEAYDPDRANALKTYYRYARDNELYLTYVIINPQADRSKSAHEQQDEFLSAGVVDEDSEGLTIRGAKMLATGGIMANEVFVTVIQPMKKGDEKYAISFAIPMNAKGLKVLSRKSYEESAPNIFDNPMAHQFDENDAVLYFDDVKVPWERVFINQDVAMCQKQFHATPAHVYQNYQAQIRLMVKMRFLLGIAKRTTETNGVGDFPQVREILGNLAAEAAVVDSLVHAMEVKGCERGAYFIPDRHTLYASQVITQQLYPKVITTLRELAGGGMIMLPSSIHDFANPELRGLINKTQQSPAVGSEDRVKFFKLAWDAVGSEFASRHTQYEMFYAGATFVTKGHSYRTYDWDRCTGLVDQMLDGYALDEELSRLSAVAAE